MLNFQDVTFVKLPKARVESTEACKQTVRNRVKQLESVSDFLSGGGDGSGQSLLASSIRMMDEEAKDSLLISAGVSKPKPPQHLGMSIKTSCHLTWQGMRDLKR